MPTKEKIILQAEKDCFVDHFLTPASKLSDNLSVDISDGVAKCWAASPDNAVLFFGTCPVSCEESLKISIPDIKNFLRLCNAIEDTNLKFTVTSNSLNFKTPALSFKYHLLDESFANKKGFNQEKIDALEYQTHFVLQKTKYAEIIRYNAIVSSVEKMYFHTTPEGGVEARIGDDEKQNTNEITVQVASKFAGEGLFSPVPLGVAALHLLTFAGSELLVSVNTYMRILCMRSTGKASHKYLLSGLVK